jgi:hypothetical protein
MALSSPGSSIPTPRRCHEGGGYELRREGGRGGREGGAAFGVFFSIVH